MKRIWKILGIRGFYRGFLGYGIVHFFMGTIMLEQNLRTGYFDQVKWLSYPNNLFFVLYSIVFLFSNLIYFCPI